MYHKLTWYKPGKIIYVNDKMQNNYSYQLTCKPGKNFDSLFTPYLSPSSMLKYGVFEGKYLNDCVKEFPIEWYKNAKISKNADENMNLFKIKSRLSLQNWRSRGWIPITTGDKDVRGWFQWYCRYWLGRRDSNVDHIQIARWRSFIRHQGQILSSLKKIPKNERPKTRKQLLNHRPKQRQALLQWAYNPFVTL